MKINEAFIIKHAEEGADRGVNVKDETLGTALGDPVVFDPIDNPEHGEIADDCNVQPRVAELRAVAAGLRAQVASILRTPYEVLILLLAALGIVEFFGGMRVMMGFGYLPPENWIFGVGLTVVIFWLVSNTRSQVRWISYAGMVALVATSAAVASRRIADATGVDGFHIDWASALINVITVIGPALIVERILGGLREAYPLRQALRSAEREAATLEARFRRGMKRRREVDTASRADAELRRRAAALFDLHYERRRAEIEGRDPNRRHITRVRPDAMEVQ